MPEAVEGSLSIPDTRHYLWTLRERLPVFVITDHPTDWPDFYVARLRLALPKDTPMPLVIMDRDLERLQETMQALGLTKLMRSPEDDPVIVETWI
jgi:hypothetical protein